MLGSGSWVNMGLFVEPDPDFGLSQEQIKVKRKIDEINRQNKEFWDAKKKRN